MIFRPQQKKFLDSHEDHRGIFFVQVIVCF